MAEKPHPTKACMSPAELGAVARDIAAEIGFGPGSGQKGVRKGLGEKAIFLGPAGVGHNDMVRIGKLLGGNLEEGVAERGEILAKFNKEGVPGELESGANLILPRLTDAVNPRALSRTERLAMGLEITDMNLDVMKGQSDGVNSAVRVISKAARAVIAEDYKALGGETLKQMRGRALTTLAELQGLPITDLQVWIKRLERTGAQNIDNAAADAIAVNILGTGIVKKIWADLGDIRAREKKGIGIADWEWANIAEHRGLAGDAIGASITIKNALARGLYAQRLHFTPNYKTRRTSAELRSDPKAVAEILAEHGGIDAIKDWARKVDALGPNLDMHKVAATLKLAESASKGLKATQEVWLAALLSSVKTHTAQLLSNAFTTVYLPFERMVATGVAQFRTHDPVELARLKSEFASAAGTYASMWASLGEAFQAGKMAFRGHDNILAPRAGVLDVAGRADRRALTSINFDIRNKELAATVDALGSMAAVPMRMLRASDEFFKNLSYRGVARSRLLQMAVEQGKPVQWAEEMLDKLIYKGQALSVDQIRRRAIDQVQARGYTGIHAVEKAQRIVAATLKTDWYKELSPLAEFALSQAEEATFSKSLVPGSKSADWQQFVNRQPALKFVTPFVKTPVNIALFGLQRLDFYHAGQWLLHTKLLGKPGSAFAESRNRLLRELASDDTVLQAAAKGRLMMGSAFGVGVGTLAASGALTGRGPSDPDQRRALMDAGWLPYSIKLGDTYVSYSRMDPMATIIGTIADIALATQFAPEDKQTDLAELGKGVLIALANNFTNKSYLQGVGNFVELLNQPDRHAGSFTKAFVSSFVPNVARDVANLKSDLIDGDETLKEVRDTLDAVMSKIPGLSDNLESKRNAFGEKIKRITPLGQDTLGPLLSFATPISSRTSKDRLLQEMANLDYGFSSPPSRRNGYDLVDIRSSSGQSAYDRWLENSGSLQLGGKTLRQALEQLVQSEHYGRLSPYNQSDQPSPRIQAVRTIVDRYRRFAFNKTQQEIPELAAAERDFQVRRLALRAGVTLPQ